MPRRATAELNEKKKAIFDDFARSCIKKQGVASNLAYNMFHLYVTLMGQMPTEKRHPFAQAQFARHFNKKHNTRPIYQKYSSRDIDQIKNEYLIKFKYLLSF